MVDYELLKLLRHKKVAIQCDRVNQALRDDTMTLFIRRWFKQYPVRELYTIDGLLLEVYTGTRLEPLVIFVQDAQFLVDQELRPFQRILKEEENVCYKRWGVSYLS